MSRKSSADLSAVKPKLVLQWGRDKNVSEIEWWTKLQGAGYNRFNGAETKMSRKSTIDTYDAVRIAIASMGPRQKCLGNYGLTSSNYIAYIGFNGAETKMSRKLSVTAVMINLEYASMGPRQKCLGNNSTHVDAISEGRLQWGRDKNVSEISKEFLY